MRIVGIDYGDSRTGLAVSDPTAKLASPMGCIEEKNPQKAAKKIAAQIQTLSAELIVLGLPKNMDGSEGERAKKTRLFAEHLKSITDLEVVLFDERCTTLLSNVYFNATNTRGKKRKVAVDAQSACIILQNYLDSIKG